MTNPFHSNLRQCQDNPVGAPTRRELEEKYIPAQSVRLGGRWWSYARLEPLATTLTPMVDTLEAIRNKNGLDSEQRWSVLWRSMLAQVRDKTWLQGIGDIVRAVEDDRQSMAVVENFGASWVPNIARNTARAFDPMQRSYKVLPLEGQSYLSGSAKTAAQKALPAPGMAPMAKMDWLGRPMEKGEGLGPRSDVVWRMVMPTRIQAEKSLDNFDRMIFNWNRKAEASGFKVWWPTLPGNLATAPGRPWDDRKIRMTEGEYSAFLDRRRQLFEKRAQAYTWNFANPTDKDMARLEAILAAATDQARQPVIRPQATATARAGGSGSAYFMNP